MPEKKPKAKTIPKTLGACVDALYNTRQERLKVQKTVTELEEYEKQLKEHLINTLPKSDQTGATGKLARATIVTKLLPRVEDWDEFYKHVAKTKSFELLQKRLGDAAIQERWDAGKKVPGIGTFNVVSVSVNKV